MYKRVIWTLISLLVVAALLAGCSSSTPTPTPSPSPTATAPAASPKPSPTASPTPVKPIVLKAASSSGPTYTLRLQLERIMDEVKKRSGGRVEFEYFPGSSLYNLKQSTDAIMDDLIQIANVKGGYYPDKMGLAAEVANLPFNFTFEGYAAHTRDAGGYFEWQAPYYEKAKMKLLSYPVLPSIGIASKKPIAKLEDLKGMLMRCLAGPAADGFKLLGAEPVFMATGEIYEGLLRGTVDATNSSISSTLADKYFEVAKYYNTVPYTTAGVEIAMSMNAWNSLPADLQKIFTDVALESEKWVWQEAPVASGKEVEQLKAKGVTFNSLTADEKARWEAALQPMYDGLAKKYGDEWTKFLKIREGQKK